MIRPDYVVCIKSTHGDDVLDAIPKSLCGELGGCNDLRFVSIDHWFFNARNKARLLGCPECVAKVVAMAAEEVEITTKELATWTPEDDEEDDE